MLENKNSFYKMEVKTLFCKYNVELNEELINDLAAWIAAKSRAAEGACAEVNIFCSHAIKDGEIDEDLMAQDLYDLQSKIYGIVWQDSLEN